MDRTFIDDIFHLKLPRSWSNFGKDKQPPLYARVSRAQNLGRQRLRSRRPFSLHAGLLAASNFHLMEKWQNDWQETTKPTQFTIPPGRTIPPGADLPSREWVTLNGLRTGVGRFGANMYRWGLHVPLWPQLLSSMSVWRS